MRVVQLTQHYRPIVGGQEVYINNLARVLREAGHESLVCQLNRGRGAGAPDTAQIPRIPFLARFISGFDSYQLAAFAPIFCHKALRKANAIIAHYAISALYLNKFHHKTVILSHGIEWRTDHMGPEDRVRESVSRRVFSKYTHVTNDTHYLRFMGLSVPAATGFFEEVAEGKWFIPNCVDTHHFDRTECLPEFKGQRCIFVPRQITPDRGIDLAIRAFAILAKSNVDLRLYVAGKVRSAAYMRHLQALAEEEGVKTRVDFAPSIPNESMPAYYSSMVATLIPTLRREGTSLSALESMSCSTPTVSTNVCGLADLPTLQCAPEPEPLADLLQHAISHSQTVGNDQARTVRETFNMERWAKAWSSVLNSIAQ